MVAGFAFASPASAWDPELLCALPDPAAVAARPALPMCAPRGSRALFVPLEGEAPSELPLHAEDARLALERARRHAAAGRYRSAVLELRIVRRAEPRLADRIDLEEAGYRMAAGPDEAACRAYRRAMESPHRTIALEARIGLTRCQLSIGDRDAADELEALARRYPELAMEDELRFLLARAHEGWGEPEEAGRIYRDLDLRSPGSAWARQSRERIAALERDGVEVRPLTPTQEVDRADRLVRSGPMDLARSEIARLSEVELPRSLAQQVAQSAARIARVEGRFDDAARLLREASGQETLEDEERAAMAERAADFEAASEGRDETEARERVSRLLRGRPLSRQPTGRVFVALRIAARAGLADEVNRLLESIATRDRMPPGLCLEAGWLGAGVGDDAKVAALFERAMAHPRYAVEARYYHGRVLERLDRIPEARADYARVVAEDSRVLPFYAMWARGRLRATAPGASDDADRDDRGGPLALACGAAGPFTPFPVGANAKVGEARTADVSCVLPRAHEPRIAPDAIAELAPRPAPVDPIAEADAVATTREVDGDGGLPPALDLEPEEIAALLEPLAAEHGDAFPWIARAAALVRLRDTRAATDELHEAYTAWREANGQGTLRADLEGVLRGAAPGRHRASASTWRDRRRFPSSARATLARASAALGDHGLAIRLGGFDVSGARPRAYADIVEASAERHGIEPELLFAVMRVESVYNPRIISYAGAIGLMQIMPRTGRLIARAQGRDDFTVDQLLDPETNIDFAAWYLASLIERFDGRIPLAVASYNGGPHNVRRWMHSYSPDLPLDVFLERIEFSQTHRYVRRVLTHYEAYRAQRGRPMVELDTTLPELTPDTVAF